MFEAFFTLLSLILVCRHGLSSCVCAMFFYLSSFCHTGFTLMIVSYMDLLVFVQSSFTYLHFVTLVSLLWSFHTWTGYLWTFVSLSIWSCNYISHILMMCCRHELLFYVFEANWCFCSYKDNFHMLMMLLSWTLMCLWSQLLLLSVY